MSQAVILSKRDMALLGLLEMTPATAVQIRTASVSFDEGPFRDERRVRERLLALCDAGFLQSWPAAISGGGLMHYHRLTLNGFRVLHPDCSDSPPRTIVSRIAPSRFNHAMATADIIVHTLSVAHTARVRVAKFHGDGAIVLTAGEYRQQPDCHFQFEHSGKVFNVLYEIDNATEPLDSPRESSIRTKLLGYEAYQDWVLQAWRESSPPRTQRPCFRVVFLTRGSERASHILWLARQCARNPCRGLCYATTQEAYLSEAQAVTSPCINDHHGGWHSLVNLHPSSRFLREPVRLSPPLAPVRIV